MASGKIGAEEYHLTQKRFCGKRTQALKHVINDMTDGATYSILIDKLVNDDYKLGKKYTHSSASNLVCEARQLLRKDFDEFVKNAQETILNQTLDLYTTCRENFDLRTSLETLKFLAKLTGLDKPHNANLQIQTNGDTVTINFGFEEDNTQDNIEEAEIVETDNEC